MLCLLCLRFGFWLFENFDRRIVIRFWEWEILNKKIMKEAWLFRFEEKNFHKIGNCEVYKSIRKSNKLDFCVWAKSKLKIIIVIIKKEEKFVFTNKFLNSTLWNDLLNSWFYKSSSLRFSYLMNNDACKRGLEKYPGARTSLKTVCVNSMEEIRCSGCCSLLKAHLKTFSFACYSGETELLTLR